MQCPFCAEEIKDEAVRCRYCGGSVHVVGALSARVAELETELSRVATRPATASLAATPSATASPTGISWGRTLLFVVLANTGLAAAHHGLLSQWDLEHGLSVLLASTVAYMVGLGLWLGLKTREQSLRLYLLSGALAGVQWVIGAFVENAVSHRDSLFFNVRFAGVAIVFVVGVCLLCIAGGVLGAWWKRTRVATSRPDISHRVAQSLLGDRRRRLDTTGVDVDRLAKVVGVVTPVLTVLVTLIGAYLTYLAAIAKTMPGR